ncbi:MAG: phage tail sheath subtilisin-like domain-containing protein [Oscillospiraceae bacterium]|nr:phage tail sheath subtilisin-like domain-containing protein [Oscillospiraceae bacterium]
MGLPTITFSLQKAAQSAAARISAGRVALILRDEKVNGLHTVYQQGDIPAELSQANKDAVLRALIGHINKPELVYLSVIGTADEIEAGFAALASFSYDYLAGPVDIDDGDAQALADLVKEHRKLRYIGKVVLPNVAADHEGVINFAASGITVGDKAYSAAQCCSRIAGILAGTPAACSATYAMLGEVTDVTAMDKPDEAVDAGKLFLINDGRRVKLSRAVTSKVTFTDDEPEALRKIKLVATVDLIRYHAISTVEDEYLGKCANSYDNKCILLVALGDYLKVLEQEGALKAGSSGVKLDAAATRKYLLAQDPSRADEIKAMSDEQVVKEDTGSKVFIRMFGKALDAMEDFDLVLEM